MDTRASADCPFQATSSNKRSGGSLEQEERAARRRRLIEAGAAPLADFTASSSLFDPDWVASGLEGSERATSVVAHLGEVFPSAKVSRPPFFLFLTLSNICI